MAKVLTSPSSFGQCASEPFDLLDRHGFEVINNPFGRKLTEDEVIELAAECVGIVAGVEPLTARRLKKEGRPVGFISAVILSIYRIPIRITGSLSLVREKKRLRGLSDK